jgi:fibronectin-binding autotransporter adhesin
LSGVFSGPGALTKIGPGSIALTNASNYTGPTTVNAGALIVNGSITSAVTVNGGTLGGSGTTGSITVNSSGVLSPGNSPGILNVVGNLTLTMGSTYLVDLNGTAVGTEYDQTNVTGLVNLGNATLSLSLSFTPVAGAMFTIVNNDLNDAVTGMFSGLPDGATFSADGQAFGITYHGGDGNDVVLRVVPEPGTWLLLLSGVATMIAIQSRRLRHSSARD